MGNYKGRVLELSLFGESHGEAIGMVVSGFPAGFKLDLAQLQIEMDKRRPGGQQGVTERNESDRVKIVSGLLGEVTTGAPICGIIENHGQRSHDYQDLERVFRPSHVDYSAYVKYGRAWDNRGSGQFSGRLTAPMVFAGALCKQFLSQRGVEITSRFKRVGPLENVTIGNLELATLLEALKQSGDSVGAVVETTLKGVPAGLGGPDFEGLEGQLGKAIFAIPGVKGLAFGTGFELGAMYGSEANDAFVLKEGKIETRTHHNGGILGGITIGTDLTLQTVFKPTASIKLPQETINKNLETVTLSIEGRHDPCIGIRGIHVVEAMAAIVIADLMMG